MIIDPVHKLIWESPESFATTLIALTIDTYGTECFDWSPMTLRLEIEEDHHVSLPPANFDRLMAAIYLLTTNYFYKSLPDFNDLCNVLSGDMFHPETFEPADVEDIAWGITEAMLLAPPEQEDENPFPEEIVGFVSESLRKEGILNPPDVLRIAGLNHELISRIKYDYSDSPEDFSVIWGLEKAKSEDIEDVVKARLQLLFTQLKNLPLVNGSTEEIVNKLVTNLNKHRSK